MNITTSEQAIKFDYFDIAEYVDNIEITADNLNRAFYTLEDYKEYVKKFKEYDEKLFSKLLVKAFYKELKDSNLIEDHIMYPEEVLNGDVYIDNFNISDERIKQLHAFSTRKTMEYDYRKNEVWIGNIYKDLREVFWYGAKPEDVSKFMTDFIDLYKGDLYDDNMFIKLILLHLTFIRIHPFGDGNGRTARLLTDMKTTELTNKLFDTNLNIPPIHLSTSLYRNKYKYSHLTNKIYFDLNHDCNDEINNYIKFMLDMYDEQIFYMDKLLDKSKLFLINSLVSDNGYSKVKKW